MVDGVTIFGAAVGIIFVLILLWVCVQRNDRTFFDHFMTYQCIDSCFRIIGILLATASGRSYKQIAHYSPQKAKWSDNYFISRLVRKLGLDPSKSLKQKEGPFKPLDYIVSIRTVCKSLVRDSENQLQERLDDLFVALLDMEVEKLEKNAGSQMIQARQKVIMDQIETLVKAACATTGFKRQQLFKSIETMGKEIETCHTPEAKKILAQFFRAYQRNKVTQDKWIDGLQSFIVDSGQQLLDDMSGPGIRTLVKNMRVVVDLVRTMAEYYASDDEKLKSKINKGYNQLQRALSPEDFQVFLDFDFSRLFKLVRELQSAQVIQELDAKLLAEYKKIREECRVKV